jgi:LPS export ABC transporter protein LptC
MNKKTLIQILMVFLLILISLLFYSKYFKKKPKQLAENKIIKKVNTDENTTSNYIDDINYTSLDAKGNKYLITAQQAEIVKDNPDTMFLENVIAYIFLKDKDTVKITSDFGKYNSKNYDTIFSKNVIVLYPTHKIYGEYLYFSFLNSLGTISTNVVYIGDKTRLFADRVEMDITTKDTKIFMNDNTKKVLTEGTK